MQVQPFARVHNLPLHLNLDCLGKCATCNNDYSCLTYQTCPNPFQTLSSSGQCSYQCTTGYFITPSTCGACTDPNCLVCQLNGTSQICGQCQNGQYLDLSTYTCVASCANTSMAITTTLVQRQVGTTINYCRPYASGVVNNYEYYVDSTSTAMYSFGTVDFPFKRFDAPFYELLNLIYNSSSIANIYVKRNTSTKLYFVSRYIYVLNMQNVSVSTYGDSSLPNPKLYITNWPYTLPDSDLITLAQNQLNFAPRIANGDVSAAQASALQQRITCTRSNLYFNNLDMQSIFIGPGLVNFFYFCTDCINKTFSYNNATVDSDAVLAFNEQTLQNIEARYVRFNLTNSMRSLWNFPPINCTTDYANMPSDTIIEHCYYFGFEQEAIMNVNYHNAPGNFIFRYNTLDSCSWTSQQTRPFTQVFYTNLCDPKNRTQYVTISNNTFKNLHNPYIVFQLVYVQQSIGPRVFDTSGNQFFNSTSKLILSLTSFSEHPGRLILSGNEQLHNVREQLLQQRDFPPR